jgi:hypothetical protein
VGQSIESLPADERMLHYRRTAGEMLRRAEAAPTDAEKAQYLSLASRWHSMAHEVHCMIERAADLPSAAEIPKDQDAATA